MPRLFLEACRNKEEYLAQLNRNLGRATMNLSGRTDSWKAGIRSWYSSGAGGDAEEFAGR